MTTETDERRAAALKASLGFLYLPPREPELQMLHRWLDSWTGVGLITVGVERRGLRLSLSHITEAEWRATFMGERADENNSLTVVAPTGSARKTVPAVLLSFAVTAVAA